MDRVDEATSGRTNLRFVKDSSDEFPSFEVNSAFLGSFTPPISWCRRFTGENERSMVGWRDVLENCSNDLLSSPTWNWLDDCWGNCEYPLSHDVSILGPKAIIYELLIRCAVKKGIPITHPNRYGYVILDKASERLSRSGY
jgi:hypothetical protein